MEDTIYRQQAIDALDEIEAEVADGYGYQYEKWRKYFCGLPSAQPEVTEEAVKDYCRKRCLTILTNDYFHKLTSAQPDIIRCRNCKFASGDSRICMKFGHSPIGELDFCAWAERRTDE